MNMRAVVLAFGGAMVGAAIGAVAWASIPDPNGVITACYSKTKGTLRVIDAASQQCAANENRLSWNQAGPQGPAGVSGFEVVSEFRTIRPGTTMGWAAECPTGKVAIAGGYDTGGEAVKLTLFAPSEQTPPRHWNFYVDNMAGTREYGVTGYATCAYATP
jgi:hypothetical protein